ncbi:MULTISPECIES: hypothetical protein [Anaeromyxobacter]|uniref:hypothetical protein n=1 Tax=Anaeromyxobacter TaxID=161492 RepID=UPI001F599110|nr:MULTISPECIES: hypothetical protein [unclassified Anaeromyxobacter]
MPRHVPLALAVALALLAAACAPDAHGDLRARVRLQPAGAPGRMTFEGVGVGTGLEEAQAVFGGPLAFPWDGTHLARELASDFGTRLDVLYGVKRDGSGTISGLTLDYTGNPLAIARLDARWREVLSAIPGACEEAGCQWNDEDGRMIALVTKLTRWAGSSQLTVTIEQ